MESGLTNATESVVSSAPTPAPAVTTPQVVSATPEVSDSSSSTLEVLKNMNWTEIAFGVLGAVTLYYAIYYFRYNTTFNKQFKIEIENKVDELKIEVSDLSGALQRAEKQIEDMKSSKITW